MWLIKKDYKGSSYRRHDYTKEMVQMANDNHIEFLPFRTEETSFYYPRAKEKLFYEFPIMLNRCVNLSYLRFWNFKGKSRRILFYIQLLTMLVDYMAMLILINKNKIKIDEFTFKQHDYKKYAIVIRLKNNYKKKVGLRSRYSKQRKVIDYRFERGVTEAKKKIKDYNTMVQQHSLFKIFRDGSIYKLR